MRIFTIRFNAKYSILEKITQKLNFSKKSSVFACNSEDRVKSKVNNNNPRIMGHEKCAKVNCPRKFKLNSPL